MLIFENEKEVYNECYTVDSNPILYFEPKFEKIKRSICLTDPE